ncbi:MAG: ABC transporter ATP-binding protein [Chloroflexi bacterium HGW-Chloroflexi-6]|nr:MAG: ABC transporter ATP-binding protein [Chloroflexi bacterium HGW-Chloroflexi-6]
MVGQLPLIELRQVVKVYSSEAGDFTALRGIDLSIQQGEFLGIVGKSGAGKSTLLNMLTGVDHATSGEVTVRAGSEVSIHKLNEDALALWRGQTMGVVYQSFQLLPMLTLLENVMLPMDLCGLYSARKSRERAMELLRLVEIEEHAKKLPAFISGGQQQRVAIARALANDPAILVADEPTGSLDSVTADHIFDVFEKLVAAGKTIVMVTHDSGLTPRFSRHLVIADGEIVSERIERLTVGAFNEVGQKKADEKQINKQEIDHRQEDQPSAEEELQQESGPILRAWPKEKKEKKKDKKDKKKDSKKKSGEKKEKR